MPEHVAAAALFGSLVFYALTAGADFGGGVWDLLAAGERKEEQRKLVTDAIGPIWEANHVWLILAVVLLFTAFPPAFAEIATKLHAPLTLLLFGIVFRGAAFTFRHYSPPGTGTRWELTFAIASVMTPVLLGAIVGASISGNTGAWHAPFPLAVGAWALAIFAQLAAAYLACEAPPGPLRDDFAKRAIASGIAVALLANLAFLLIREGAPDVAQGLRDRKWAWSIPVLTAIDGGAALFLLQKRRVFLARLLVAVQVFLILLGWVCAQYPILVAPRWTIQEAAASRATLILLDLSLGLGALLLFPSLAYLYRVFKGERAFTILE